MSSRLAALALIALLAAGCTQGEAGQASPASTTTEPAAETGSPSSSGPSASPTPAVTIPPRPRELKLDGVDPCTLFTDAQLAELKMDRARKTTNGSKQYKGMAQCILSMLKQPPYFDYSVIAATNEGIEVWLTGNRNVEAWLRSVAGFPAATYWIRGSNGRNAAACDTAVDVAQGQQLMVSSDNDSGRSLTLEQLCQRAEAAAALAIQTLQTLK